MAVSTAPRRGSASPKIGQAWTVLVTGAAPNVLCELWLGRSNTNFMGQPLPIDLGPAGAPGCVQLQNKIASFQTLSDGAGQATLSIAIANNPALVGTRFFTQWFVTDPALGTPLNLAVSNGLASVVQ